MRNPSRIVLLGFIITALLSLGATRVLAQASHPSAVINRLSGKAVSGPAVSGKAIAFAQLTATIQPVQPVITATPGEDGSIVHVVDYGQTLEQIAAGYGMKLGDLLALNDLDTRSVIYPGEKLIIRKGATATPTSTTTLTPTRTPRPSSTPRPPTSTPTRTVVPSQTPTPTKTPLIRMPTIQFDRRTVGIGLVSICSLGLVVSGLLLFRKS